MPEKIGPLDIYNLLPKTNCKECGETNCMAFATKLVERTISLDQCPPLLEEKYKKFYLRLKEILKPPVKEITIGVGDRAVKIGGKLVMYRHELRYANPTAIAIDVTDDMPEDEILKRVKEVESFTFTRIGQDLKLDMIALRSTSNDPAKFGKAAKTIIEGSDLPLILCSFDPNVLEAGLAAVKDRRPLIYAATKDNWKEVGELALMYKSPLAVFAPNDLKLLRSLTNTLLNLGVEDLALDPGTFCSDGLNDTINNFTMIRRAAFQNDDKLLGFPIIGVPLMVWKRREEADEVTKWEEAYLASTLLTRFADLLIMHGTDPWVILPVITLRQNMYTDPMKPVSVEPGLKAFGKPDENSPVFFTSNFALTYYTVAGDIESAKINGYLIVVDTEGLSVESGVAGRKLTADKVADAIKKTKVEEKVRHRKLIIPGRAARLRGDLEDLTGWEILVGPLDSSGIPKFLQDHWNEKG